MTIAAVDVGQTGALNITFDSAPPELRGESAAL